MLSQYRAQLIDQAKQRGVDVFPENWHAVKVFLGMGTQWRVLAGWSGAQHLGLDYASLPIVLAENRRVEPRQPLDVLMPQLRTLEAKAKEILNQD